MLSRFKRAFLAIYGDNLQWFPEHLPHCSGVSEYRMACLGQMVWDACDLEDSYIVGLYAHKMG